MDGVKAEPEPDEPYDQATAMPSTPTFFQVGLLRPPTISALASRCVPSITNAHAFASRARCPSEAMPTCPLTAWVSHRALFHIGGEV